MFELIAFGGVLFWFLVILFFVIEGALLYNEKNGFSILFGVIFAGLLYLFVPDMPEFNYKFLLIYPILALLWLPTYWYLELRKTAYAIKAALVRKENVNAVYYDEDYQFLRRHIKKEYNIYEVDIQHPKTNDLFANTLFFPVSIIIFLSDSTIRMVIDQITEWMESIRENFNAMFKDLNKDK